MILLQMSRSHSSPVEKWAQVVQERSHSQAELLVLFFGVYSLQCLATCTKVSFVGFIKNRSFHMADVLCQMFF